MVNSGDSKAARPCGKVILTSATWSLSGVNTLSANMVRGFRERGVYAGILLTRPEFQEDMPLAPIADVPLMKLPVGVFSTWKERCHALLRYLEEQAPCIYIPNFDWGHSCISPLLSPRVLIVGILHSEEWIHFEHAARLGRYWNAIVAVSEAIAGRLAQLHPELDGRIFAIPNGVPVPSFPPRRSSSPGSPLEIIYTGRLEQYQKRVLDLPEIAEALDRVHVPFRMTIAGDGVDRKRLEELSRRFIVRGSMRFTGSVDNRRILELLAEHDVFLLTSEFEGMPISVLEAMAHGCVPVVTDVRSGIPELIDDGINGFRVPVGDIGAFADRLRILYHDVTRRKDMGFNAHRKVSEGGFRIQDTVAHYLDVFDHVIRDVEEGVFVRPQGKMTKPLGISSWNYRLPDSLARMGIIARHGLRKLTR